MKHRFVSALLLGLLAILATSSIFAQASTTASASATIVTPIAIAKTVDMNFGNVAVTGTLGTVILDTTGTRTKSGGVTLPNVTGTVAAAVFSVTGQGSYTYSITLPTSDVSIADIDGDGHTMIVNAFVSNPSGTGQLTSGAQTLKVGATLHVAGNQDPALYSNALAGGFTVTVNYN